VNGTGLTVTTPSDREIVLTRDFAAPPELVFAAWTRPELLMRWYGARGWNLVDCTVDLRVGGAWRFVSRGPDGDQMVQSGIYQDIQSPRRLVYTERFDEQSYPGETLISHELTAQVSTDTKATDTKATDTKATDTKATDTRVTGTRVTSTVRYATREGRDRVLAYPMRRGAGESFDRLDTLLAILRSATHDGHLESATHDGHLESATHDSHLESTTHDSNGDRS
jgi:uncharacterized protein YndB with AHSA1/START domain